MDALALANGNSLSPLEGAIATSLRALNDGSAITVGRRFLSALLAETGAIAAGLLLRFDYQPTDIIHAPGLDPVRRASLRDILQGGRPGVLGGHTRRWALQGDNILLLYWPEAPAAGMVERLGAGLPQLELFLRQLRQLAAVESARLAWQHGIRHQAMLSEALAWLSTLEETVQPRSLYAGLLTRARILCNAERAALALYRVDGSRFQWLAHHLTEADVRKAQEIRPHAPEPATIWQATVNDARLPFLELAIATPKGLRARLYLCDKREQKLPLDFTPQDVAFVNQLSAQVFRFLEKIELVEDLRISNHFLAMERQDLNRLVNELKDTQQQLLHSEKLASLGQLAAGVAHEINNPVSFVNSNLFHLQQYFSRLDNVVAHYLLVAGRQGDTPLISEQEWQGSKADITELLAESRDGLGRVRHIVQDLRNFSRVGESGWQLTDINECLDSTLNIVRNEVKYKADVIKTYGELPLVQCVANQINQVILNLLVNAAQSIPEHGCITLESGHQGSLVFFRVRDNGSGISPEHIGKIFDPFFTTKPVGKGTGLGLSLSYGIIQRHHGRLEVESEPGSGSCFTVWLPVEQADAEPGNAHAPPH